MWQPGQSGNPHGRAKGSKNLLAEKLIFDLTEIYSERSKELLTRCLEESPLGFLQALIKIIPRETIASLTVNSNSLNVDISIEQRQKIAESWLMTNEAKKEPLIIQPTKELKIKAPIKKLDKEEPLKVKRNARKEF